ncbi:hypothetical protein FQN49_003847 [Arthroderma sp. PD_2]|nr:hypothetical protein FQN49_003847 [Arthroderma sp. PD_2]
MKLSSIFSILILPLLVRGALPPSKVPSTLNVTAITAEKGFSTLECWAIEPGFDISDEPGTKGAANLPIHGLMGDAEYSVLPPRFDGGLHTAPTAQWVIFVSGLAHITLPNGAEEAWVRGGVNGAIIAADTADVSEKGHFTVYPSNMQTIAWQIPLRDGTLPKHRVLHRGACRPNEGWS